MSEECLKRLSKLIRDNKGYAESIVDEKPMAAAQVLLGLCDLMEQTIEGYSND